MSPGPSNGCRTSPRRFRNGFRFQGNVLQNKSLNFDRNGAFYESVGYADYALSEYLTVSTRLHQRLSGHQAAGDPSAEDGRRFLRSRELPDGRLPAVRQFRGQQPADHRSEDGASAPGERLSASRPTTGISAARIRDSTTRLGWSTTKLSPFRRPPDSLPKSVLYPDIGWAVLRSSWQDNATMLAVKSGFTWNHAHPDAGSFILFHQGKPMIIDSGTCSYSRPEYSSYYRQSKAHNVVLIDGAAQNPEDCSRGDRGVVTPGRLPDLLDLAGVRYVFADATGPTSWKFSRNYRHFLWIDDVLLIFDDIRTHEPGQLEWLLHYEGTMQTSRSDLILTNGDAKVVVTPIFPPGMKAVEKKGLRDHDPDRQVTYLALTPPVTTREAKFVTAIVPLRKTDVGLGPEIDPLTDNDAAGVRIADGKTVTEVWLNLRADGQRMHRNSNNIIDGWDTDAYLLALTRPVGAGRERSGLRHPVLHRLRQLPAQEWEGHARFAFESGRGVHVRGSRNEDRSARPARHTGLSASGH